MELAKLILEYVKVLTWPVTTIILVVAFRTPLKAILVRLRKAALPGGVSIDFQEAIQEAKELSRQVDALPAPAERRKTPAIPLTEANARMLNICNRAIHGQTVSEQEAQEVIDAAAVLARYFLSWLSWGFDDNWKPRGAGA